MCWCAAEDVEVDVEPVVDLFVDGMIFVAEFLRGDLFFDCFRFCRCAVFVCTADEESVQIASSAVSMRECVSTKSVDCCVSNSPCKYIC